MISPCVFKRTRKLVEGVDINLPAWARSRRSTVGCAEDPNWTLLQTQGPINPLETAILD